MKKIQENLSGKNINFLIGSGASYPLFKTLDLGDDKPSLEELLSSEQISEINKKAIYYFYYVNWIKPMKEFDYSNVNSNVTENYKTFINTVLFLLDTSGNENPKRANIFTTNFDLLFEYSFEEVLKKRGNCYFNDGSRGFINRVLNPQSYNLTVSEMGYYNNYKKEVSTINLSKMHGSVSWTKSDNDINVFYEKQFKNIDSISELNDIDFFKDILSNIKDKIDLKLFDDSLTKITSSCKDKIEKFYEQYKMLAIINPNKWKFHETVFEQHYYQLIRNFSYELEKPNTILIVFAFSFADEHIEEIIKRAITNPTLEVYIICFREEDRKKISDKFGSERNIFYYPDSFTDSDGNKIFGNFEYFNKFLNGEYDDQ